MEDPPLVYNTCSHSNGKGTWQYSDILLHRKIGEDVYICSRNSTDDSDLNYNTYLSSITGKLVKKTVYAYFVTTVQVIKQSTIH